MSCLSVCLSFSPSGLFRRTLCLSLDVYTSLRFPCLISAVSFKEQGFSRTEVDEKTVSGQAWEKENSAAAESYRQWENTSVHVKLSCLCGVGKFSRQTWCSHLQAKISLELHNTNFCDRIIINHFLWRFFKCCRNSGITIIKINQWLFACTHQQKSFKKNFAHLTCEREKGRSRMVWCVADTLDNTGNEALEESDNYFN